MKKEVENNGELSNIFMILLENFVKFVLRIPVKIHLNIN